MTANLFTTTAEAEARLVTFIGQENVPGFQIIRKWPYIDATVADTLVVALEAVATYSGPKADNQAYSGTFVNSEVRADASVEDDDRQVVITQTLTLVSDLDDNTDLTNAAVRWEYFDEEINHLTFDSSDLSSKDGWVQSRQGLKLIIENVNPASAANLADRVTPTISEAQWETRAGTAISSQLDSTSAWEFRRLELSDETNATLTVNVFFSDPDFGTETDTADIDDSLVQTTETNTGGYGVTTTEILKGKDIAVVETILANGFTADTDRTIDRTAWTEANQGEAVFTKFQTQSDASSTAATAPLLIMEQAATGNLPAMATATWFRVSTTIEATLVAAAKVVNNWNAWFSGKGFTTANGFVFDKIRYNRHPNGTVDITANIYVPRTRSFVGPDSEKKYCIRKSYTETSAKEPNDSVSGSGEPTDGKFWRTVMVLIEVMWTKSDNKAQKHAQEGLNGSFSRFDRATGLFYAEKYLDRKYGDWTRTGKKGVADNVVKPADGLNNEAFENNQSAPVVEGTGNCGEIIDDK